MTILPQAGSSTDLFGQVRWDIRQAAAMPTPVEALRFTLMIAWSAMGQPQALKGEAQYELRRWTEFLSQRDIGVHWKQPHDF
jgi:hypothetical protein